jgi:putative addiction module killer protein
MFEVYRTDVFIAWLEGLRDKKGRAIIDRRLDALELGHFGDSRQVAKDVIEMRIHFGPGYRVYLTRRGKQIVILLCGGDKRSQKRDIERAAKLAENVEIYR